MEDIVGGKIEFEDGYSELANELNMHSFRSSDINSNSYFKIHGPSTYILKEKIKREIKNRFDEENSIIEKVDWGDENSYFLYAILKKEFNYFEKFPTLDDDYFGNSEEKVKYFGLNSSTGFDASENVEILFYNSQEDFAIKLKTIENEEIYLYKNTGIGKSFEENYQEILKKQKEYKESRILNDGDILKIPFIEINAEINYDELCGRYIKGTNIYIKQAVQTVDFELNNRGGCVKSEALVETFRSEIHDHGRKLIFDDSFLLFLKESSAQKPYLSVKVDDISILKSSE